jgi:hypothetical protein
MVTARRHRLVGVATVFALVFAWSTHGFCPMQVDDCIGATPATSDMSAAHRSCHSAPAAFGLQGTRPACCHAEPEAEAAATVKSTFHVLPATEAGTHAAPQFSGPRPVALRADVALVGGHGPPLIGLRI